MFLLFLARVSAAVRRGEREGEGRTSGIVPKARVDRGTVHHSAVRGALQIATVAFGPRHRAARLVLMLFTKRGSAQVQKSEYNGDKYGGGGGGRAGKRSRAASRSVEYSRERQRDGREEDGRAGDRFGGGCTGVDSGRLPAQAATREGRKQSFVQ